MCSPDLLCLGSTGLGNRGSVVDEKCVARALDYVALKLGYREKFALSKDEPSFEKIKNEREV